MNKLKIIAGLLGLCGAVFALICTVERTRTQPDYMAFLHSLRGSDISQIVISKESYSDIGPVLCTISSPVALDAFARAANKVNPYEPEHPEYLKSYYIQVFLVNGKKREFLFETMQLPDKTIYVDFVHVGFGITYFGNCKSIDFFDWIKAQIPDAVSEPN